MTGLRALAVTTKVDGGGAWDRAAEPLDGGGDCRLGAAGAVADCAAAVRMNAAEIAQADRSRKIGIFKHLCAGL